MSMDKGTLESVQRLKQAIAAHHNIVVLSGAGISVPSGIPDFRSATGLYSTKVGKYSAEEIISHDFFVCNPREFYDFYKDKMIYPDAKPNAMHLYLASLEKAGKILSVITQNIDGLHSDAGSKRVLELHGSIRRNRCENCHKFFNFDHIINAIGVPVCDECGGIIKPEVVLYGEMLDSKVLRSAVSAMQSADMLIVIGTSLVVYPAAGLIDYFGGDCIALVNKSATYVDSRADILIKEDCAEVAKLLEN